MALAFIAISQVFVDFGLSAALIQNQKNDNATYSSVFFLNLGIAFFFFLICQIAAPLIAQFYGIASITNIIRWLSLGILFNAFNIVQNAILQKELKFKVLSLRMILSVSIAGCVGIYLAITGYGVYALVIQSLLLSLIASIVLWSGSEWRPSFVFNKQAIYNLSGFSIYLFLSRILGDILSKLDALVIGKLFSPATLGFYTRANTLNQFVALFSSESIIRVFYPVMSSIQDQKERFQQAFLKVLSIIAFITFFLSGILILSGEYIIITLFGEKWRPSVFIFQICMLRIFAYPINALIINAFLALGKAKENFWYGNIRKSLRIIPFIIAYFYGFKVFLYSLVGLSYIGTILNFFFLDNANIISFKQVIQPTFSFLTAFILALLGMIRIPQKVVDTFTKVSLLLYQG